jgi:signal transduction histidine kinase
MILLAAVLLLGSSFHALVAGYLHDSTLDRLENDAATIAELASAYYTDESLSDRDFLVNLSVASQVSNANAVICDRRGALALCSDSPFGCGHQGWCLNESYVERVIRLGCARDSGVLMELYDQERYVVSVPIVDSRSGHAVGIVMVSTPTAETDRVLKRISDIFLSAAVIVIVLSVVVMTVFLRGMTKPLQDMAKTAYAFGHGELTARVPLDDSYSQEIEELALAFNNMASSLQKSEYQRQEFVANVSHELKTPMTTIGGYIDGILDGTIPPQRSRHYMQIVSDETKRLSRLVRSMLDISRLQDQGGIPEEKKTRFDVEECAGQVLITFEPKITAKKLNVDVKIPDIPVYTLANQDYITQVIYNLLDNAVKFCPAGGTLGVRIREGDSKAYISISNDGQTIPPEELPLVFDRFHKLDKSRSENRDGWGLGLYIAKTLICGHGEDISVTSAEGKTEFTFTLPLSN